MLRAVGGAAVGALRQLVVLVAELAEHLGLRLGDNVLLVHEPELVRLLLCVAALGRAAAAAAACEQLGERLLGVALRAGGA